MPRWCLPVLLAVATLPLLSPGRAQQARPAEPLPGSIERKGILDALRKRGDIADRVFVVRFLKAQDGWAWVVVDPRSRDNANHYETESALLEGSGGAWRVVDGPCAEDGCDARREMARIRSAHPKAPAAIFPP